MDNAQKLWAQRSLHQVGGKQSNDVQEIQNKPIPCSVVKVNPDNTVLVKLEINTGGNVTLPEITIPQHTSEWARVPTQVGDKGFAHLSDYYMGGMSGSGGGTADLYPRSNLTNLVFHQVSNTGFMAVDQNSFVAYGPNGVTIMTQDKSVLLVLTKTGVAITGDLTVTGNITAFHGTSGFINMKDHIHSGVVPGGGTSSAPVPGT